MKKIKILLTFFVATLLILGVLSQLSVWYDNRAAAPVKRLLQGEIPRGDSKVGWALAAHAFHPKGSLKPRKHECPPRICLYPIQPLYENGKFKNLTNNC